MTLTQLKIVLLTAHHGSISGAARELGIPQPNASSGIKVLEKELGFTIFKRENGGVMLTEKGQLFIDHTQRIIDEIDSIDKLNSMGHVFQMRVGCTNYYRGKEAFIKLCTKHKDENMADLQYYNVSFDRGMVLLSQHKLDFIVGITLDVLLPTMLEIAKDKRLTCLELDESKVALTLGKDHPIVKEGLFENGIDTSILRQYPYIAYHTLNDDFDMPYYKAAFEIPCKYKLFIEEKETRFKLAKNTNGFMLGVAHSPETLEENGLVQYDYPGYHPKVICMFREIDKDRDEIKEIIDLI